MLDVIVYDNIKMKNVIESTNHTPLVDPHESLVHTLNMMDFMAALNSKSVRFDDDIEWIVLNINKYDK